MVSLAWLRTTSVARRHTARKAPWPGERPLIYKVDSSPRDGGTAARRALHASPCLSQCRPPAMCRRARVAPPRRHLLPPNCTPARRPGRHTHAFTHATQTTTRRLLRAIGALTAPRTNDWRPGKPLTPTREGCGRRPGTRPPGSRAWAGGRTSSWLQQAQQGARGPGQQISSSSGSCSRRRRSSQLWRKGDSLRGTQLPGWARQAGRHHTAISFPCGQAAKHTERALPSQV